MSRKIHRSGASLFKRSAGLAAAALFLILLSVPASAEEPESGAVSIAEAEAEAPADNETLLFEEEQLLSDKETTETEPQLFLSAPAPSAYSSEDPNYILVEKKFSNLPPDLIPDGFQVTVSSAYGSVYVLSRENTLSRATDFEGNTIWRWRITGVGTGMYTVSESGETVNGYYVAKSGEGTVDVRAAEIAVSVPVHETTCSHTNWPVRVDGDSNVLFAATLTQGGIAVISRSPLSASQRAAVSGAVLQINGPWKNPVYFYSIEEQLQNGSGFELNGATITYDASSGEVIIGRTRNWQHVATLQYSISEADNPEISLNNIYSRAASSVTVKKTVAGNMADRDRFFDFTVSVTSGGEDAAFTVGGEPHTGRAAFSLKHGESVLIDGVPLGAQVVVAEADCTDARYTASYEVDQSGETSSSEACIPAVAEEGHSIIFTNRKEALPDTGLELDSMPYLMILGAVIAGSAALRKRR